MTVSLREIKEWCPTRRKECIGCNLWDECSTGKYVGNSSLVDLPQIHKKPSNRIGICMQCKVGFSRCTCPRW